MIRTAILPYNNIPRGASVALAFCLTIWTVCIAVSFTAAAETGSDVVFRSDGNAVYAFDAADTSRPAWSADGLVYRERYSAAFLASPASEIPESPDPAPPEDVDVPRLRLRDRLYVALDKVPGRPWLGNVLVALDLRTQGKLLWRIDAVVLTERRGDCFKEILEGENGALRIEADDGRTFEIDVTTGEGHAVDEIIL